MNEAPNSNQTTGLSNTFSSQPAPQTNPFTADLKGEFASDFGTGTNTGTNAVSQIFKEGGFSSNNPKKIMFAVGAVVVVLALAFVLFTGDPGPETEFGAETAALETEELVDDVEAGAEGAAEEEGEYAEEGYAEEDGEYADEEATAVDTSLPSKGAAGEYAGDSAPVSSGNSYSASSAGYGESYSAAPAMSSGPISLVEPADGSSLSYDETQGAAVFSWSGGGGYISFSRNPSMNPTVMRVRVSGNQHEFHHPWPGTWYWKVENASGSTEVRSFQVQAPARRNIAISEPQNGGAVAGNGGTVSWQGDNSVAFYRVEMTASGSWANPEHRFATSGNSVSVQGVAAGQYQMRVGAFSEVSGRWEFTAPVGISVQ